MEVIHTVNITREAVFDYEFCTTKSVYPKWSKVLKKAGGSQEQAFRDAEKYETSQYRLDKRLLKTECAEYIAHLEKSKRIPWWGYFQAEYEDELSGKRLKLFFYKGERLGLMQVWDLKGICLCEDWTQEAEDDGRIRHWLKLSITDLEKDDWVLEQQVRLEVDKQLKGWARQCSLTGLPQEIQNAIEHGNNQEFTEALLILQNAGGKRFWRGYFAKKYAVSRKLDKRDERERLQADKRGVPRQNISRKDIPNIIHSQSNSVPQNRINHKETR